MRTCVQVKGRTSPSLARSLPPRFLPSRLGRDFETGSPRPTSPAQVRAWRRPGAGCTRKGISLPPSLGDAHAQGKPPSLPSLSPSLPPSLLSPHFRNGWVLQCGCALSWLASAASQGGGFPLAWPPATVGAKAPLGGSALLSGEYWTSTGAQGD